MRNVVLVGSTGSIGRQTLDVARRFPDRVRIAGISGYRNTRLLAEQAAAFHPDVVAVDEGGVVPGARRIVTGVDGLIEMVTGDDVDLVVMATVGSSGIRPTLAALSAGKMVALANKETLVAAGPLIAQYLGAGGRLVPIDSEHSAIWQCLQGEPGRSIETLTLTASGGALRDRPIEELHRITPQEALRHPTWEMGRKVTIDSATLMNKGLEVIEARWLFDVPMDRISIVQHAQSIVHSLVIFDDSSTKAQLGLPDMRLPIQYALSHPERWGNDLQRLDLASLGRLTFGPIDTQRYPALQLALDAGRAGGTAPAVLCAADEVAVDAFLDGQIAFTRIPEVVAGTLEAVPHCQVADLDGILEADRLARDAAGRLISG